ncbi:MAG: hypothetical protein ACREJU_20970 [Nitrospiraceae bacterium]
MSGVREEYEAIAVKIRTMLSLSTSSSDLFLDSVHAALKQGDKIGAIRLVRMQKGLSLTEAKTFVDQLATSHPNSSPSSR